MGQTSKTLNPTFPLSSIGTHKRLVVSACLPGKCSCLSPSTPPVFRAGFLLWICRFNSDEINLTVRFIAWDLPASGKHDNVKDLEENNNNDQFLQVWLMVLYIDRCTFQRIDIKFIGCKSRWISCSHSLRPLRHTDTVMMERTARTVHTDLAEQEVWTHELRICSFINV